MVRVISSIMSSGVVNIYDTDAEHWYGPPEETKEERVEVEAEETWTPKKITTGKEMI